MRELTLEHLLLNAVNNKEELNTESFNYQSVFLNSIVPDISNPRFMPAKFIDDAHAKLFIQRKHTKKDLVQIYDAEDCVLIGKSCIVNCLKYGSSDWHKANKTIESIIEIGENIAVSEVIQVPTIYPVSESLYQVLTGHRRFFGLIYANGYGSASQFKVYSKKPLLGKIKQFQENSSRADLPQYGKLTAFLDALAELDALSTARLKVGKKKLTIKEVANLLGISMGAFDNYNVLTRYSCVVTAYEDGLTFSYIRTKKIILKIEHQYRAEKDKKVLNATDKKEISAQILKVLSGGTTKKVSNKSYNFGAITNPMSIKKLLTNDMSTLLIDVDWDNIDWQDSSSVNDIMTKVVDFFERN